MSDIAPIFQYVASTDPFTSKTIANQFGIDSSRANDAMSIAACLQDAVAAGGNDALAAVVDIHPDKALIVEMAGNKNAAASTEDCDCKKTKIADQYVQAASGTNPIQVTGNTFIIGAVVILGLAIVFSQSSKS